jgi:peptidyl-prolyl cis-trans isomerase SurA
MTALDRIKSTSAAMRIRMLAIAVVLAAGGSALAQNVVVFVNGDPITAIDIEQRSRFLVLTTQKHPSRQQVLDELIDEALKVREGKRWGIDASKSEIDSNYAGMARRMNQSAEQLTQNLAQKGVSANTLKARIRADLVWQQLIRGRYRERLVVNDSEVLNALTAKNPDARDTVGYEYLLRPILFLVQPGAGAAAYDARKREAEALRKTFKGCQESIPGVRAMNGVAVRAQVVRSSADLPDILRKVLDSVPVGELTPPEITRHGVEVFAVCSKNESKSDTRGRREVREELTMKLFEKESKAYLRRLRKGALIESGK